MSGEKKKATTKPRSFAKTAVKPPLQKLGAPSQLKIGQAFSARPLPAPRPVSHKPQPGISITVQIPALRRPKPKAALALTKGELRPRRQRRKVVLVAVVVFLLVAGGVAYAGVGRHAAKQTAAPVSAAQRTSPSYQPLVPSAAQASATEYDGQRNMVSYTTTFSAARVTVSEQALPVNFAKDPAAIQRAADSIKATQKLDTGRGPLFIATYEASGDQRAIFADAKVLLFIHADKKLDDVSWKSFVELLKPKSWESL